jgi:dCMP deaminase
MGRWKKYFLTVCEAVASNSKCLSRQIGAVLVKDKSIIATGYNGPPRGVPHCGEQRITYDNLLINEFATRQVVKQSPNRQDWNVTCPRRLLGFSSGEGLEWCIAAHAEQNCLVDAARKGVSVFGATLYLNTQMPCKNCLILLINAGVKKIVYRDPRPYDSMSRFLLKHSNISVETF